MWLLLAAGAAVCFGVRGILYQWTSKQPADRNLLLLGVYLCGAAVALMAALASGQSWTSGAWMGLAMGAFSFVSNASMHKGFSIGKASLVAILTGLPPVVVVTGALVLWGEKLSLEQGISFAVILSGVLLLRYSGGLSKDDLQGAGWGLLALVAFALTDLSGKQATLWQGETFPTLVYMYGAGSLLFGASVLRGMLRLRRGKLEVAAAAALGAGAPSGKGTDEGDTERIGAAAASGWSVRRTLSVGVAVGLTNICGMMLLLPAFRLGVTGLVSIIVSLNVLIILGYARVFLRERFTVRETAGMALALVGLMALRYFG